jgi:putative oxidoreductase
MIKHLVSTHHKNNNLDWALLIARLGISSLMLFHGIPKLMKLFGEGEIQFGDPIGLGPEVSFMLVVFAEFFCSVLLFFGFATRIVAIPLIITMLVAVFIVHSSDGFGAQELGLHYLLVYVILLILGSGRYSIDGWLSRPKKD